MNLVCIDDESAKRLMAVEDATKRALMLVE